MPVVRTLSLLSICLLALCQYSSSFSLMNLNHHSASTKIAAQRKINPSSKKLFSTSSSDTNDVKSDVMNRRSLLNKIAKVSLSSSSLAFLNLNSNVSKVANAIDSVTTSEFQEILKTSYRSIESVEFSGPKGETAVAKLIDGTLFEISDLVESPVDPRSPLKLASILRGYGIPTKFTALDLALNKTPKRTKVYYNSRVQEAAKKEAEKAERIRVDEEDRVKQLELYEASKKEKAAAAAEKSFPANY